jgi:hypothetical protein
VPASDCFGSKVTGNWRFCDTAAWLGKDVDLKCCDEKSSEAGWKSETPSPLRSAAAFGAGITKLIVGEAILVMTRDEHLDLSQGFPNPAQKPGTDALSSHIQGRKVP